MSADKSVPLPDLGSGGDDLDLVDGRRPGDPSTEPRAASDLEAVFDVPVAVSAVLGRARLEVQQLMRLRPGAIIELDRKIGEAIDIYVNDRLVARGEVVLVEERLGVTMTEIIKPDRA
ncbi:flagellar motor switch protein FliN [Chenggangzhangella methanolivorans]|uniref:Flagellar motor switch protein FliN n=1 Tax=Chenggangzhangella methanolivorans TaxID=1437009 RepID=A0A9E6R9G4_9HYPH|nr:flagellar motor switch protein FliN [Chenggangzhangella methanolivorans]QZN99273.1 flagellar motor switch protein FliN [Chenggangzhangella methanolivorans]